MRVGSLAHADWLVPVAWIVASSVAAVALSRWHARRRRRRLIGDGTTRPTPRQLVSDAALLIALTALGAALLGPRIGERLVVSSAAGVDLVVLVDVSRSMDAQDNPPSRLDRARRGVAEVLDRLEASDRVALAAFAGRGVLLTPLTPDRQALLDWVDALDSQWIQPASSDLAAGIDAAVTAFELGSERPRVIFVVSDGEDPRRADELGVGAALGVEARVVALALGSERGAAVPDRGVPLRDAFGRLVVSRRHAERLARLSRATGGAQFAADEWGSIDFAAAVREIRRDVGTLPGQRFERRVLAIRVAPFAVLALALLLLEGLPRSRLRSPGRVAIGLVGLLALLGFASPEIERPDDPGVANTTRALEGLLRRQPNDPLLLLELGRARLGAGQHAGAARAFLAAAIYAADPATVARAHYSRGVAELERSQLGMARDAFFEALAFDPSDRRARFNLEWTLLALATRPPESPQPGRDPAGPEPPEAAREPRPPAARESQAQQTRPARLDAAARARSLNRIVDHVGASLRAAARGGPSERRRSSGPAW